MIVFTHSNHYQINDCNFLAAWELWFDRFGNGLNPLTNSIPRHNTIDSIFILETRTNRITENNRQFSLEYLSRILVPSSYRNTMQATNPFMDTNSHLLSKNQCLSPFSNKIVNAAELNEVGKTLLIQCRTMPEWDDLKQRIESCLDSDIEISDHRTGVTELIFTNEVIDDNNECFQKNNDKLALVPAFNFSNFIQDFVDYVHVDQFQPKYRGRNYGGLVSGWSNRLNSYFWPKPTINLHNTLSSLAVLNTHAAGFMGSLSAFPVNQQADLINWADQIFKWGGVPQPPFNYIDVLDVLSSVNVGHTVNSARMNSGWTKVASFASEVLAPSQHLVIWDSRVAHSLVTRFEFMLVAANYPINAMPEELKGVGYVRGRGGNRKTYIYNTARWTDGYKSWPAIFKGSEIVRLIRDDLNTRRDEKNNLKFPCPVDGGWTVRLVEMVLFMDGY